ncbi:hypothetical protein FC093_15390 [Ilyomonas limi]|uniref:Uncharacterized protein n=1 Tax=Ilyomonas limi TaxID=2575867 RepID=A0A4U3KY09_9BACT|nr:hypothetical protein [Ilyomonas limi]TKK67262.1 hypothetical protein FC093_15390 [Ilyomonas limi]
MKKPPFEQKRNSTTNLWLGIIAAELAVVAVALVRIAADIAASTSAGTIRKPPPPPPQKEFDTTQRSIL